jgi:RimJ/RimL family protein N-acetyltransferase
MREVLTYRLADATKVTLRPAGPDDAAGIIAAVRSSSDERSYVLMEVYGKDVADQRGFIEALDRQYNLFLVATVDDTVVGILALLDACRFCASEPCCAVGIHLVREWRGRGIGSALLRYGLRWADERGYRRVEADIFTANKRSLHLFRKAGFREVPRRSHTVQVGAQQINEVVLVKRLD